MTDTKKEAGKLDALNNMLIGVENNMLKRRLDVARGDLEHAYDFINLAAENGDIDIDCGNCDQEVGEPEFADDEE